MDQLDTFITDSSSFVDKYMSCKDELENQTKQYKELKISYDVLQRELGDDNELPIISKAIHARCNELTDISNKFAQYQIERSHIFTTCVDYMKKMHNVLTLINNTVQEQDAMTVGICRFLHPNLSDLRQIGGVSKVEKNDAFVEINEWTSQLHFSDPKLESYNQVFCRSNNDAQAVKEMPDDVKKICGSFYDKKIPLDADISKFDNYLNNNPEKQKQMANLIANDTDDTERKKAFF